MVIQLYLVITYPFPSNARRNTIQTEHRRLHQSKRSLQGRKGPGAGMHCIPGGGVATINDEMSDPVPIPPPKNPPISEVPRFSHIFKFVLLPLFDHMFVILCCHNSWSKSPSPGKKIVSWRFSKSVYSGMKFA